MKILPQIIQELCSTGQPKFYFAMALYFSLMSISPHKDAYEFIMALLAAIMLYAGLHYMGLKGIPL